MVAGAPRRLHAHGHRELNNIDPQAYLSYGLERIAGRKNAPSMAGSLGQTMYGKLYDSMLVWYQCRRIASSYLDLYAATSLTSMGFLNIASLVVLCAHWNFGWAKWLLREGRNPTAFVVLGVSLLCAHLLYSRWRKSAGASPGLPTRSSWIAGAYMLATVVAFIFVNTLAPR